MKVLHLSSEKAWRGGEQQIAYLIEELLHCGVEIMVACRRGSAFEEYCIKMEIPHKSLPFRHSLDLYSAHQLKKLCQEWQPQLIHAHSSKSFGILWIASLLGLTVPTILSRKVAFEIKNNFVNRLKYNSKQLKKIICVTGAVQELVLPLIRNRQKTCVIHDGIDTSLYLTMKDSPCLRKKYKVPVDAFLIGTTAAFTPEKDYPTFFKTAQQILRFLPNEPFYFLVMGEGPEKTKMQEYCRELEIERKVCFTGFVPEAGQLLHELDIFLFTSKSEGLGSSILDAFANRCPVVSTAVGGIPEIIQHGESGLLAPAGDYEALAKAVLGLFQNHRLRSEISEIAYKRVQSFDRKITAKKTLDIYHEVLHESH